MGYFEHSPDEAESSFYSAFENLDLDLMQATWHRGLEIYCVHPGGPALTGYEQVLKNWSYILGGGQTMKIDYKVISAEITDKFAIHLVEETVGGEQVKVLATNTYIKTENGWRMFSHHASMPPEDKITSPEGKAIH